LGGVFPDMNGMFPGGPLMLMSGMEGFGMMQSGMGGGMGIPGMIPGGMGVPPGNQPFGQSSPFGSNFK